MSPTDRVSPVVGLTGARFGGSKRVRAAAASLPDTATTDAAPVEAEPGPEIGLTGARFGGSARRRRAARAAAAPEQEPPPPVEEHTVVAGDDGAWIGGVTVRPYVRTGGRTRPAVDLAVEALVSAVAGMPEPPGADHRAVAALCASPRSVAEVAALLQVPLGVARVLVGDLAQSGVVVVHGTSGPDGPDSALMQRVLDGLKRI